MRRSLMVIVLAVALVVTAGALLAPRSSRLPPARPSGPLAALEQRLERLPNDWTTWAELGLAYVKKADYPRAKQALSRSLAIRPDNALALTGRGALANALHDFPSALKDGRSALAADPYRAAALGVVADALTELGRYDEAFATVQQMVDLRPDTASYARASYTWELRGDTGRATEAMQRALDASTEPADTAFARLHLGQLALGDLAAATTHFTEGLKLLPGHPPLLAAQARVRAARGDIAGAIAEFRAIVAVAPQPAYFAELGDLLLASGHPSATVYAEARKGWAAQARSGLPPEPDLVLFAADQRDPAAVDAGRRLYERQPGIASADALGWALHTAGRSAEALRWADEALRLGTRSGLFHYHRGMILANLGKQAAARAELETALRIDPHFSVRHGAVARAKVVELR
jgi:tetratricopeptide (TPR) repeat protein